MIVGERCVVHHLQKDVENVGMGLLYLVEQQHTVGRLAQSGCQLSAVLVAHISCRSTDEFCHGMLLGILAHVEAHEAYAQLSSQSACHLGLAHTRGPHEQQRRHRFVVVAQSGFCHLHSLNHLVHGTVLSEYLRAHVFSQRLQRHIAGVAQRRCVNLAHLGKYLAHQPAVDGLALLSGERMSLAIGSCLVDEVDGLVGQEAVADVACRLAHGKLHSTRGELHSVELLVARTQSFEYAHGVIDRGFGNVDLLESAHQRLLAGYVAVVFVISGRADESYFAAFEIGLEHIGGIERSVAARTARPNHIVYLVDVEYGVALSGESFHHLLDALLEVATKLRSGYHRAHVHHVYAREFEAGGHVATGYACCQSVYQRCLADTCLAHVQRIVLVLATQHLYGTFQFSLASDERIVLSVGIGYARHKLSPSLSARLGSRFHCLTIVDGFLRIIVAHERCHEIALIVAYKAIEFIGSTRLLKHKHGGYELWHVDNVNVGILCLTHRESHHLGELVRAFDGVAHTFGHTVKRVEIFAYGSRKFLGVNIDIEQGILKRLLTADGEKHVFGCHKLVAPCVARLNCHTHGSGCIIAIFQSFYLFG